MNCNDSISEFVNNQIKNCTAGFSGALNKFNQNNFFDSTITFADLSGEFNENTSTDTIFNFTSHIGISILNNFFASNIQGKQDGIMSQNVFRSIIFNEIGRAHV